MLHVARRASRVARHASRVTRRMLNVACRTLQGFASLHAVRCTLHGVSHLLRVARCALRALLLRRRAGVARTASPCHVSGWCVEKHRR
jgi:hypothetical protein